MLKGDRLDFIFSYIQPSPFFSKVAQAHILRESDLDKNALREFRNEIQPWVNAGFVRKTLAINPDNPPEEEYHYSLTKEGEKYYSLNPVH